MFFELIILDNLKCNAIKKFDQKGIENFPDASFKSEVSQIIGI